MNLHLTATQVLAGLGGLIVLILLWRASARAGRRAAQTARASARLVSLGGRVVITAALIVGVQWVVITHGGHGAVLWSVLGGPALLASYTLTRALTVTTVDPTGRHRGDRR